jgi:hypothetical protein
MCDTEVVKYIIAATPNQNSIRSYRRPLKASAQAVGTSPDSMSGVNTENMMELMTSEHSRCCRTTICRFLLHSMAQGGRGGDLQEASLQRAPRVCLVRPHAMVSRLVVSRPDILNQRYQLPHSPPERRQNDPFKLKPRASREYGRESVVLLGLGRATSAPV